MAFWVGNERVEGLLWYGRSALPSVWVPDVDLPAGEGAPLPSSVWPKALPRETLRAS